jgi:spore coat protein U-like protein
MFKLKFLIIFVAVVFLNPQQSYAQSSAKADIIANCTVNSPSFPFETYKSSKTESNSITATVTVSCNNMKQDIPYSLSLSKASQLFIMNKGTEIMYYQLFTAANFATLWDDTNTISGIVRNNNGVGSDTRTVYAKILRNDIAKKTGAFNLRSDPVIINLHYLP